MNKKQALDNLLGYSAEVRVAFFFVFPDGNTILLICVAVFIIRVQCCIAIACVDFIVAVVKSMLYTVEKVKSTSLLQCFVRVKCIGFVHVVFLEFDLLFKTGVN